ncbi:amino acid permease [Pseudonocardia sp. H11422]|uniref:amino acid permease n=1 Tax=Pseudonocardia sp. H11422 TaxID=2835866 RepID=UPI00292E0554|nr:amino acid permease [Pseudonocardia sp. H11422]
MVTLAAAQGTPWPAVLLDLGIATSFVTCTLATTNALVRVLFSMGRDGITPPPRVLGATHRRYRTPHVAIAAALPVAGAVPALMLVCGTFVVSAIGGPVPVVLAALLVAAVAWYVWLRVRRPAELTGIGVYDETSVADVHGLGVRR